MDLPMFPLGSVLFPRTAIPLLGAMGVVFCAVREWRGTVLASGTTHALNNAVAVTLMLVLFG